MNYKNSRDLLKKTINKLLDSSLNKRLASHALWSLFGSVFSKVLILIGAMLVARILGKEEYGSLGIIRSTIQMFIAFAGFGIGATASKFIAENREIDSNKTIDVYLITNSFSLFIGVLLSLIIILFAPYIAVNSLNAPYLTTEIRIGGLIFLFSVLDGSQNGILSGFEDFKALAKTNIIKGFTQVILSVLLAYYYGLLGAIVGFGLSFGVAWFCNFLAIRKQINKLGVNVIKRFRSLTLDKFSILWEFSLPAAISAMIMPFVIWWVKTLLVKSDGFEAMANYDVAEQWRTQLLFIPAILSQIVLPLIANTKSKGNRREFMKTIKVNFILNITITSILTCLVFLFGKFILKAYGSDYVNVYPLYILALSTILVSASNILFPILMIYNKMWYGLMINIFWCISCVMLSKNFLDSGYGETGLSFAILFSYCISVTIQVFFVKYLFNLYKNE